MIFTTVTVLSQFYIYINFCTAPMVKVVIGALEIYNDDDDDDETNTHVETASEVEAHRTFSSIPFR